MKCERCHEQEASVFLEQTINGESKSMHLCEDCATVVKKEGLFEHTPFPFGTDIFNDLFGFSAPVRIGSSAKTCPDCGASKSEKTTWDCPQCGKKDIDSGFCPDCGHKF